MHKTLFVVIIYTYNLNRRNIISDKDTTQTDQGSEGAEQGVQDSGTQSGGSQNPDVIALMKKIDALESDNKKYRDIRREKDEADKKKSEEEAIKKGEFEKLFSDEKATSAKLTQALEEVTKRNKDYDDRIIAQTKKKLDALTPEDRKKLSAIIDKIPNATDKLEALEDLTTGFQGNSQSTAVSDSKLNLGNPVSGSQANQSEIEKLELIILKHKDPKKRLEAAEQRKALLGY